MLVTLRDFQLEIILEEKYIWIADNNGEVDEEEKWLEVTGENWILKNFIQLTHQAESL